jgi:SAM-dependent methyltransferase
MGIAKGAISLLYKHRQAYGFSGKMIELGKQNVFVSADKLNEISERFGQHSNLDSNQVVDDVTLFKQLGFSEVQSLDYSKYEDADIEWDLNNPIPLDLRDQFDAVYDGGTIEHIFHLPQVLGNIFHLLKVGGTVVHCSPSHNHVDHGYYMFSPQLIFEYYAANNFEILASNIFEYESDHAQKDWLIYEYTPGSIDRLSFGGWGRSLLGIWIIARKTESSTCDVIPQQGTYIRDGLWSEASQSASNDQSLASIEIPDKGLKTALKAIPFLRKAVMGLRKVRMEFGLWVGKFPKQPRPPVIDRY